MRVLRRRSNLEVSSTGFALFVVGLMTATFLGGAVRTILSSDRVHQRIVRELKSRFPKNDIAVGHIEVLLSRGLWPGLALRVRDISVKQNLCGKLSFDLRVPEALLPVNILSLRGARPRLGRLDVPSGTVDLDFTACPRAGDDVAERSPGQNLGRTLRERGIRPPRLEWSDVAGTLDGVNVSDLEVTFRRLPPWKLRVVDGRVRFGRELTVTAALDVQHGLPFGTLSHPVALSAVGRAAEIEWQMSSELKEGRVRWTGRWNLVDNTAVSEARLVQIPLKELANELFLSGVLGREFKFKSAWLSGALQWSGPFGTPFDAPVILTDCHVEGGYGRATLERAEVFFDAARPLKDPAEFALQRAQLQGLAEAAGVELWPAILARPGLWTGRVIVETPVKWAARGRLEGVEIAFSNENQRAKQLVTTLDLDVIRAGEGVSVHLDDLRPQDGAAEGAVEAHFDLGHGGGRFDVRLPRVVFSPVVQRVLAGRELGPIQLTGSGDVTGGRVSRWDGTLHTPWIVGLGWRVDGIEARTRFSGTDFTIDARANRATAGAEWRFGPQLAEAAGNPEAAWRDLHAKLVVTKDGGQIPTVVGTDVGGRGEWRAQGGWRRGGELTGRLRAAGGRGFGVRAERGRLAISPE